MLQRSLCLYIITDWRKIVIRFKIKIAQNKKRFRQNFIESHLAA